MFGKLFHRRTQLTGSPPSRRLKTYSSQAGYVYEYFYEGHRLQRADGEQQIEYVFNVSSGRDRPFELSVFLSDSAVSPWQSAHGRSLSATEKYALAKLALFQFFDERPTPPNAYSRVDIHPAEVEAYVSALGL